MQTIIFVAAKASRQLGLLSFEQMLDLDRYRLVLITSVVESELLDAKTVQYFSKIITVSSNEDRLAVSPVFDYAVLSEVVGREIGQNDPAQFSIMTPDEANTVNSARLRSQFNIPGPKYDVILGFKDKQVMKERVQQAGLRVPKFQLLDTARVSIDTEKYYYHLQKTLGLTFVMKPTKAAASHNVFIIDSLEQFSHAVDVGEIKEVVYGVEEFIEGTMYHVETITEQGKITLCEAFEYTCPNIEMLENKVLGSIILPHEDALRLKLIAFAQQALVALGSPSSTSHMELFVTEQQEIIFLEVGARPCGHITVPMWQQFKNINLMDEELRIQSGMKFKVLNNKPCYVSSYWIPAMAGEVKALTLPALTSSHAVDWKVSVGEMIGPANNIMAIAGILNVWNTDYEALYADFLTMKEARPIAYLDGEYCLLNE